MRVFRSPGRGTQEGYKKSQVRGVFQATISWRALDFGHYSARGSSYPVHSLAGGKPLLSSRPRLPEWCTMCQLPASPSMLLLLASRGSRGGVSLTVRTFGGQPRGIDPVLGNGACLPGTSGAIRPSIQPLCPSRHSSYPIGEREAWGGTIVFTRRSHGACFPPPPPPKHQAETLGQNNEHESKFRRRDHAFFRMARRRFPRKQVPESGPPFKSCHSW